VWGDDVADLLEALLRFVGHIIGVLVQGLIEWFLESGVKKLPRRPSLVGAWWRRESIGSKLHSLLAGLVFAALVALLIWALWP
jgi:hypothetical protein